MHRLTPTLLNSVVLGTGWGGGIGINLEASVPSKRLLTLMLLSFTPTAFTPTIQFIVFYTSFFLIKFKKYIPKLLTQAEAPDKVQSLILIPHRARVFTLQTGSTRSKATSGDLFPGQLCSRLACSRLRGRARLPEFSRGRAWL